MWTRVCLNLTDTALSDLVSSELWSLGAQGVELRDGETFSEFADSAFERQSGDAVSLIGYFPADFQPAKLEQLLEQHPALGLAQVIPEDDASWQDGWRQYFSPARLSERITVRPSWDTSLPEGTHHVVLVIDPGMAFGTGTHETTQMCLQVIDRQLKQRNPDGSPPDLRLLDVGCGSGILSMAAAKLGVSDLFGVDIDAQAIAVARENWASNGLGDESSAPFSAQPLSELNPADLVVANMLSHILLSLRTELIRLTRDRGRLLVSGILIAESAEFFETFGGQELSRVETFVDGQWTAALFEHA